VLDVVLDTDIASLVFRRRLPATMSARLAGRNLCITYVTVGELCQWAHVRAWGRRSRGALDAWIDDQLVIDSSLEMARLWGRLAGSGMVRGRTPPVNDTWLAACCLVEGLPLVTNNVKDFADFAAHHGLELIAD
jgi:toxin FitB